MFAAAALVVATLAAYAPALDGGFLWDDDVHVSSNRNLRDAAGLRRIWTDATATPQYYPLTHTSFWLQYHVSGLDTRPYHVVNVLLHALAAWLLWRVLALLEVPGAGLAAAILALHPVEVESVAWITERKNVLSAVLVLGSALAYLTWAYRRDDRGLSRTASLGLPGLAVGLYLAALLAKTVAAVLPAALAIVLAWRRRLRGRDALLLGPMLLAGAAMGQLTAFLERYQVGARGADWAFTPVERVLIAGRAIVFYAGKLLWPVGLSFQYRRWTIDAASAAQYLFPLAVVAAVLGLALAARRIGWGPFVAMAYFGVAILPASGLFDVFPMRFSFVADHFQYLASAGPIALGAAIVWLGAARAAVRARVDPRRVRLAVSVLLVGTLSILTWRQAHAYTDLETLWRHTLAENPDAWLAHYNLGKLLADRGETDEAMAQYREALAAKPDLAEANVNLANALADGGDLDGAIGHYEAALSADPDKPLTHYDLGLALEQTGRVDRAEAQYREAIRLDPGLGGAHNNLAILLYDRGEYRAAARELELAARHGVTPHPDFVRALADRVSDTGVRHPRR